MGIGKKVNYLYSGMVYILQHSSATATAVGWQLEQSFALFVSAHTEQGSKEAPDFIIGFTESSL